MQWTKLTRTVCDNINMLKISPFEKFDYCLHHGLNLFLRIKANKLSQQSFVRADRFIIHMQELLNLIVNSLISEIAHCKKTTGRVTGKGAAGKRCKDRMKTSIGLFVSLLKKAYLEFCKTNRSLSLGHKCLFLNKNYMVTKVISSQMRKLAYICLQMGLEKEVTATLSDLADFLRKEPKYINQLYLEESNEKMITDYEFSHLSEIEHFVPDMERMFSKSHMSSKLVYQLQTIEHRIHSCSENRCTNCYDQAGLKHIYFYLEALLNNMDDLQQIALGTEEINNVINDAKLNLLSLKEYLSDVTKYSTDDVIPQIVNILRDITLLPVHFARSFAHDFFVNNNVIDIFIDLHNAFDPEHPYSCTIDLDIAFEVCTKIPIQLIKKCFLAILQLLLDRSTEESEEKQNSIRALHSETTNVCNRVSTIKKSIKQCKSELSSEEDFSQLSEEIMELHLDYDLNRLKWLLQELLPVCNILGFPLDNIQRLHDSAEKRVALIEKQEYLTRRKEYLRSYLRRKIEYLSRKQENSIQRIYDSEKQLTLKQKQEYLRAKHENKNQRRKFLAPKYNLERHRVNKVMFTKRSYKR